LGFAPGFGFMGLVDERLASPRLSTRASGGGG
jgi:allophanate hydrolase subunit 1